MKNYFEDVLRIIRALTFRYNVIGKLNPNDLERAYNKAAIKVHNQEIKTPQSIQRELQDIYVNVNDEVFKNSFSACLFDTRKTKEKKLVRYILLSLENQLYNKDYHLFETNASIEHIFPENYFNDEEKLDENMIYRLGNLTLLEPDLNKKCGNKSFKEKIEHYKNSQYEITRKIAEDYDNWNAENIKIRQNELAKVATSIWRFPY
jgi:hypothetical protein